VQVQRDAEMADRGSSMLLVLLILELFHGEEFNHLLDVIVEEQSSRFESSEDANESNKN
jgi:hypothetical protein